MLCKKNKLQSSYWRKHLILFSSYLHYIVFFNAVQKKKQN